VYAGNSIVTLMFCPISTALGSLIDYLTAAELSNANFKKSKDGYLPGSSAASTRYIPTSLRCILPHHQGIGNMVQHYRRHRHTHRRDDLKSHLQKSFS
jgi:hypothetical protein